MSIFIKNKKKLTKQQKDILKYIIATGQGIPPKKSFEKYLGRYRKKRKNIKKITCETNKPISTVYK